MIGGVWKVADLFDYATYRVHGEGLADVWNVGGTEYAAIVQEVHSRVLRAIGDRIGSDSRE